MSVCSAPACLCKCASLCTCVCVCVCVCVYVCVCVCVYVCMCVRHQTSPPQWQLCVLLYTASLRTLMKINGGGGGPLGVSEPGSSGVTTGRDGRVCGLTGRRGCSPLRCMMCHFPLNPRYCWWKGLRRKQRMCALGRIVCVCVCVCVCWVDDSWVRWGQGIDVLHTYSTGTTLLGWTPLSRCLSANFPDTLFIYLFSPFPFCSGWPLNLPLNFPLTPLGFWLLLFSTLSRRNSHCWSWEVASWQQLYPDKTWQPSFGPHFDFSSELYGVTL